jgi:hypothetical protein
MRMKPGRDIRGRGREQAVVAIKDEVDVDGC